MLAAQELYVHGEISYPRTDNTVYPSALPCHEILGRLRESTYGPYAERLLAQPSLDPSRGPIQPTAHPPVHPTAAPAKRRDSVRSRMYDLVARRFLATLSPASVTAVTEVRLTVGDSAFLAIGRKILDPGWREILPEPETITELPPFPKARRSRSKRSGWSKTEPNPLRSTPKGLSSWRCNVSNSARSPRAMRSWICSSAGSSSPAAPCERPPRDGPSWMPWPSMVPTSRVRRWPAIWRNA